jgi:hypothetical protein
MDLTEDRQIYRYWVELRDLRDGSVRVLPLQAFKRIHLPTKKEAPHLPDEVELQVEDGTGVIKARDIDDLVAQLRLKYPDGAFERFLRRERDKEAEERKAEAMEGLIKILAKAVYDDLMREQARS